MHKWLYTILIGFSAITAEIARSQDDPVMNFREKCRKSASGSFSNAYGDLGLMEDAVILAEKSKKKARAVLENHEAKLRLIDRRLKDKDYPTDLLRERDALGGQIKLYHEQYTASEEQLDKARKNLVTAKQHHDKLKAKIEPLFKLFFSDDPDGGERKIFHKLEWKYPCPKYRSLCPLPADRIEHLTSLIDEIDDQDFSCHRYSKLK